MIQESDYIVALICPNILGYSVACDSLLESKLIEQEIEVSICADNMDVCAFLSKELGFSPDKRIPTADWIVALNETFPPPLKHIDILIGKVQKKLSADHYRDLINADRQARVNNRIESIMTIKSPEDIPLSKDEIIGFLENNYKPMINSVAGHEDFVPDNYDTTESLLRGEPDIIPRKHRTFKISCPFQDITNSVQLMELLENAPGNHVPEGFTKDSLVLTVTPEYPQYLHLICLAFAECCKRHPNFGWMLLQV